MKKIKKKIIPNLTEFTDDEGKKWIQTSADDLFSTKEINSILKKMEKTKESDEIVLARIDFQQVNKEYYETVVELQNKLEKQNASLKKLLIDAKETIDRKNKKLKELIDYIRKLHLLLAYYKMSPEDVEKILAEPGAVFYEPAPQEAKPEKKIEHDEYVEEKIIAFTDVKEILLDEDGNEKGPLLN